MGTSPRARRASFVAPLGVLALALGVLAATTTVDAQYSGVPKSGSLTDAGSASGITPQKLRDVRFDQKLGAAIPLDLPFRDETGRVVRLGDYFTKRPVILTLVYYECPMLCTQVLNGLVGALKAVSLEPGRDFDLLTVSFNPQEKPALAADKKRAYLQRYQRPDAAGAWHFLTGEETAIRVLADSVGFHYVWDPALNQYAHATGIMVVTPGGKLAKYFYGIEFSPRDLRLALVDASNGAIGNPVDQVLLYCYHYDPSTGRYGFVVFRALRLAGAATVLAIGAFIFVMIRRERHGAAAAGGHAPRV
jgi:protein SCO1/2